MLDHILEIKGECEKIINKIVDYTLYSMAHNGSGFDSYVVISNVPQWRSVVNLNKKGAGIVSPKIFKGYVDEKNSNMSISDVGECILKVV